MDLSQKELERLFGLGEEVKRCLGCNQPLKLTDPDWVAFCQNPDCFQFNQNGFLDNRRCPQCGSFFLIIPSGSYCKEVRMKCLVCERYFSSKVVEVQAVLR